MPGIVDACKIEWQNPGNREFCVKKLPSSSSVFQEHTKRYTRVHMYKLCGQIYKILFLLYEPTSTILSAVPVGSRPVIHRVFAEAKNINGLAALF